MASRLTDVVESDETKNFVMTNATCNAVEIQRILNCRYTVLWDVYTHCLASVYRACAGMLVGL